MGRKKNAAKLRRRDNCDSDEESLNGAWQPESESEDEEYEQEDNVDEDDCSYNEDKKHPRKKKKKEKNAAKKPASLKTEGKVTCSCL